MGRTLGAKNKLTKTIKDSIEFSFNKLPGGGGQFLLDLAATDPKTYCQLLAKVIPNHIDIDSTLTIDLGLALVDANSRLKLMRDVTPNSLAPNSLAPNSLAPETFKVVGDRCQVDDNNGRNPTVINPQNNNDN